MNDGVNFERAAGRITHEQDAQVMTSYRFYGKPHCRGCVDEYGCCVACAKKEPKESASPVFIHDISVDRFRTETIPLH